MKNSGDGNKKTVVIFERDANFFVQRGIRLAQRFEYEKAIRSFRRAVELEPTNAHYMCHLASVLAEIGQFSESNEILHQIIEEIDPEMVEVYFYLAHNYANLEDFQKAEEMALRYLQETKDGMYAAEAEELLDYIYSELDVPPRPIDPSKLNVHQKHELARKSLEEGRFLEAMEMLQAIIREDDRYTPAWNNLALAYYYVGDFHKALRTIEETLAREPRNLHALCNLAVLLSHHNRLGELAPLLSQLRKTVPLHYEQLYKLATTLGVLGQHAEAYRLFRRLFRYWGQQDASTYHYAAISAYQSGHRQQALEWWQKARQLDPDTGIADYYLRLVKEQEPGNTIEEIPYHYQLPYRDYDLDYADWAHSDELKTDPMIRASLLWALQHGTPDVKRLVIQTLALIGDREAEEALCLFSRTTDDRDLGRLALMALYQIRGEQPEPGWATVSKGESERVAEAIRSCLRQHEQTELCRWALSVWSAYCEQKTNPLKLRKPEAWVAALEYLYAKKTCRKVTQKSLAAKYGLSLQTIAKCVREISALDLNKF